MPAGKRFAEVVRRGCVRRMQQQKQRKGESPAQRDARKRAFAVSCRAAAAT
jgi:hypothetical protein